MTEVIDQTRALGTIHKLREEIWLLKAKVKMLETERMNSSRALITLFEIWLYEDSLSEGEVKVKLADIAEDTRKLLNRTPTPAEEERAFKDAVEIRSAMLNYTQSMKDKARAALGKELEEVYSKSKSRNKRKS